MGIDRWLSRASMRLRSLFGGGTLDRELDEELWYHVDRLVEANVARGLSADAARREALLSIGGVEQRKEECRDTRRVRLIEDALQDVRYAIRTLRRSPAFTTAAILTLALGIGATVPMFTVVNGLLLRPMPFPQPEQLFLVSLAPRGPFMRQPALSDHHYMAFRARNQAFDHLAAFAMYKGNLTGAGDPAVITVGSVTTEFFSALQIPPAAGRTFLPGDDQPGRERIVVLSEPLWRGRLGSDPAIVGKDLTLDGVRHAIVGVMPSGFDFPNRAQAWTPKAIRLDPHNSFMYPVLGRLKPDVTVAQARAQFDTFMRQLPDPPGAEAQEWLVGIFPLKDLLVGEIRRSLQIFAGAVMFVLLIACANVANLLLARASGREREIAVRATLGAGRARLIRQLLTESALLALSGGALGILAARWGVPALLALALPVDFNVDKPAVSRGYFGAMGITLIRGRDFSDSDDAASPGVAIASRSVARALSPSEDVVGKRVTLESRPTPADWLTIVGVVNDIKQLGPALPSHPAIYRPYLQVQRPFFLRHMNFVVRTATDPVRVLPSIRSALRAVDKDQPAASIALMNDVMGAATAEPGFQMRLLGTFAMLAVMLALLGTYGVLAYSVALRTHEIGLRMALGARSSAVLWIVIRRTLTLSATGVAFGTIGALLATRLLGAFLFEITPTDPATFVAVALTILVAALAAGFIPARRATQLDPLVALRHE